MALKVGLGLVGSTYSKGWFGSVGEMAASKVDIAVDRILATQDTSTDPRVIPLIPGSNPVTVANYYTYGGTGGLGKQGQALYGVYNPTSNTWTQITTAQANQSVGAAKTWSVTNPYGAAAVGNAFYLIDNDNVDTLPSGSTDSTLQYSASIYKYDLSGSTPYAELGEFYRFVPGSSGGNTWKGAGTGLDVYAASSPAGTTYYLIATFNRYYIDTSGGGWGVYHYGPSALVKINSGTGAATTVAVNANTNGVVVEGNYAYVTSYGAAQQAGGNASSELQVVSISGTGAPTLTRTKTVAELNTALGTTFGGDFIDVAFVNSKAYVLSANYNSAYSQYNWAIIQTTDTTLQGAGFGTVAANERVISSTSPASPCFALLPGGDNSLYFVDGVNVKSINTAINVGATGGITPIVGAGNFSNSGTTGYVLNTAGVVIEKTPSLALKGAPVRATVTKLAKRLARPEDLEKEKK
jgi:uncharacterized membrane protein